MPASSDPARSLVLWTYPIGGAWGHEEQMRPLLDAFTAQTGIEVRMEILSYENGDKRVQAVLGTENAPDLVLEGPERLVADWGLSGAMEDLGDMIDPADRKEIHRSVLSACTAPDGGIYIYPLARTVQCMAINEDAFRSAGALQYVNLRKHTWTTDQFHQAVSALFARYGDVGTVYCGGQGGDQGTRALVTNLYGGSFTDPEHSRYTWDDPLIIQALEDLRRMKGIYFDPYMTGGDEIKTFLKGKLKMAFCWNISQVLLEDVQDGTIRTQNGEKITFMAFPAPQGVPKLLPGIWGFGICKHADPGRVAAAKEFIRFMCDSEHTREAVRSAGHLAVRTAINGAPLTSIWSDNDLMREYHAILPYIAENNQILRGWRKARTAWWTMLQKIGEGGDIPSLTARYAREANQAIQ